MDEFHNSIPFLEISIYINILCHGDGEADSPKLVSDFILYMIKLDADQSNLPPLPERFKYVLLLELETIFFKLKHFLLKYFTAT